MTTWAILPVKRLDEAKSSLSVALSSEQRQELVFSMLADMLSTLREAPSINGTIVVSPSEEVLKFARVMGAEAIKDPGLELNQAFKFAISQAVSKGATSVLLMPSDLAFLKTYDIENMISMATSDREVVIAPSKDNGTNALLLRPPDIIELRFGGESFPLHLEEARRAGVVPRIYRSFTVATDIDEPADLFKIENYIFGSSTRKLLRSLKQSG
ncbi:MAG: hypothetical protein APU95_05065 [Hadesarchaea archaeon YNP_N21]|nr:MAG: hypothetical protein APU95_05065 [Hadesarchaea archaeon YNP_N21]